MNEKRGGRLPQSVYLRRRLGVVGAFAAAATGLVAPVILSGEGGGETPVGCETILGAGDTLWGVAEELGANDRLTTTGQIVHDIRSVNPSLTGNEGEVIRIPAQYCES